MDKDTRNFIERATQKARKLLEEDFAAQLEGDFDVHGDGGFSQEAGGHLSARQAFQRERIVAAIEHKFVAGMDAADSVADYLRDSAFTTINRFVALKMLEARELVQECITKGEQSAGYREFSGMAPGVLLLPNSAGYRLYIESLFDELSTEVKVLFDRRDASSVLWPKRATFEQVLEILNDPELAGVWVEDETIGWVYQFFNGQDERRKMREESQAPRNSRELAIRNQFFTPRYVVQFLVENTLGRMWYEMRSGATALVDRCGYLVRTPDEECQPRHKKDPRDILVLDPACGSGHFLLYAFDLFAAIYEEAYADPESPKSGATGRKLSIDYPSIDDLRKAVPGLILAHNLHGVDIDPRCVQIAQLALWMRVQREYRVANISRAERPRTRRTNIVVAEPLVADDQLAREFVSRLDDIELARVFMELVETLKLAGDLGLLLPIETLVARSTMRGDTGDLFAPPEDRIRAALDRFVAEEGSRASTRKRLFADDATQGIGLLAVAEKTFDVVLMNPPFGEPTKAGKQAAKAQLARCDYDLGAAFMHASTTRWARGGFTGVVSSSTLWFKHTLSEWRRRVLVGEECAIAFGAHLGGHVLDNASVGAVATVLAPANANSNAIFFRCLRAGDKAAALLNSIADRREGRDRPPAFCVPISALQAYRKSPLVYWISPALRSDLTRFPALEGTGAEVRQGVACADDPRFVRAWWELPTKLVGARKDWLPFAKSSEYSPFWDDVTWIIRWKHDGAEVRAYDKSRPQNIQYFGSPGVTFPARAVLGFNPRAFPAGIGFGHMGSVAFPKGTTASTLLGYLSSRPAEYVLSFSNGSLQGRKGAYQNHYEVGQIGDLPWPDFTPDIAEQVANYGSAISRDAMQLLRNDETTHQNRPSRALHSSKTLDEYLAAEFEEDRRLVAAIRSARASLDELVSQALGFRRGDIEAMNEEFAECDWPTDGPWSPVPATITADSRREAARSVVSLAVGLALGRFDARRFAGNANVLPESSPLGVFEVAPWTVLDGLPQSEYPISVLPSEMLTIDREDPKLADRQLGDALSILWPNATPDPVAQLTDVLLATHLSEYLTDPGTSGFYTDHVRRYSKGRRRAPLYFWFGTTSGAFGILLLATAATPDSLFVLRNDILQPRILRAERTADRIRSEAGARPSALGRAEISAADSFVAELRAYAAELELHMPLWAPNVNDGVVINAAPFYRLIPHRESRSRAKATWTELCDGELDWSQLAMRFWPERVVPKCATDRSLAIAHGLEDVFWYEADDGKWSARLAPLRAIDELVRERMSPAVKSALQNLMNTRVAIGNAFGRGGRRRAAAKADELGDR
ncbi:BREX-1 system adenine-specific DNA-methyltransferase PglX [Paraburkholderia strydomiana]|uniref:BREX-1 system adenine-specific DNA-methyltransferase PglX n=1 Tax=Paraburkholderia strydomiana TaxID=1245417 RepID=UPI0038BCDD8E